MEEKRNGSTHHQTQSVNQKCGEQSSETLLSASSAWRSSSSPVKSAAWESRRQRREM